jgi:hypothetical protein
VRHLVCSIAALLLAAAAGASDWSEIERVVESPHPYPAVAGPVVTIQAEGARAVRVHFERLSVEDGYDFVDVLDAKGRIVESLTGELVDYWTRAVEGDRLTLRLRADEAVSAWGFRVDRYAFLSGRPAPLPPPLEVPDPGPIDSPIARLACLPAADTVWEGGRTMLEVLGYDRAGRPVEPGALDVFWNVLGEGAVVRTRVPGRFEYRAPRDIDGDRVVRLRVYDARRPEVRFDVRLEVRHRAPITGLAVVTGVDEIWPGQAVDLRIEGRSRVPETRVDLAGWPLRVRLEGPGRLEPLPGVGRYRYVADDRLGADDRPTRVVIHASVVGHPEMSAMTVILVRPRPKLINLRVSVNKEVVEPGEKVEIRVEGVLDRKGRARPLRGRRVDVTARVRGTDRHVGTPTRMAVRKGRPHARVWVWRAPERIRRPMEVTIRAAVGDVTGKARLRVVRPLESLVVVPAVPRIRAGDAVEIRIEGHTVPPREVVEVGPGEVTLTLDGPGTLRSGKGGKPPRYEAPKRLARAESVTVTAILLRRPGVRGAVRILLTPDYRCVDVDVRCAKRRLSPGEETEVRLTPRMSHADAPAPKDLTLTARLGWMRRVRPGTWAFRAPTKVAGRREIVLRAVVRDGRGRSVERPVRVLVEAPGAGSGTPIDTDHLFEIVEWKTDLPGRGGEVRPVPKDGVFRPRGGTTTFRADLLKPVRTIHVEMTREGKDEVKRYDLGDKHLELGPGPKGRYRFVFEREFGHPGKRYAVRVIAVAMDGEVYRQAFVVVPR